MPIVALFSLIPREFRLSRANFAFRVPLKNDNMASIDLTGSLISPMARARRLH